MTKTRIVYTEGDFLQESWVNYIAIQTATNPPHVFAVYGGSRGIDNVPSLVRDLPEMIVVPVEQAKQLYDFEKVRNLDVCVGV